MSGRAAGGKGGRPSSELTVAQKKQKKVDDQRESRDQKKVVLSDAVNSSHIAFVVGEAPFGHVTFDPNLPITTTVDGTSVDEFVDFLFSAVEHRFCLLELLHDSPFLDNPNPVLKFASPEHRAMLNQAANQKQLEPLVHFTNPPQANPPTAISSDLLKRHKFYIDHVNVLQGFLFSQAADDGGVSCFIKQSSIIKYGSDSKIIRFLSFNVDVLHDGHDVVLYDCQTLASYLQYLQPGEPLEDAELAATARVRTSEKYFGILGQIADQGGVGMYPPISQHHFWGDKTKRDLVLREFMMPGIYRSIPYDIPDTEDAPGTNWNDISWTDLCESFWSGLRADYADSTIPVLDKAPTFFPDSDGLVIKPTNHFCAAIGMVFVFNEGDGVVAKTSSGVVYDTPAEWFGNIALDQLVVRVEPYNEELRKNEFRAFFLFKNSQLFKSSIIRTSLGEDGRITKHEHLGFLKKEPNSNAESAQFKRTVGLWVRGFNGYPNTILKGFQRGAKTAGIRQPIFFEGVTYRVDFSRDKVCGPPTQNWISEVTPVAPGDSFCFYANEHWFVAYHIHEGFLHFMNKYWGNWPN